MVEFGKKLLQASQNDENQDWKEYYIDYKQLKKLISKAASRRKNKEKKKKPTQAVVGVQVVDKTDESKESSSSAKIDMTKQQPSHQKNQSSLGNILDLMASSTSVASTTGAGEEEEGDGSGGGTSSTTATPSAANLDFIPNNREIKSMIQDGYLSVLEFRQCLDQQIEKLVLFSLSEEGSLAKQLYGLSKERQSLKDQVYGLLVKQYSNQNKATLTDEEQQSTTSSTTTTSMDLAWQDLESISKEYRNFACQLLKLMKFMDLNVTGLRKILKKHDKNFPHYKLSGRYLHIKTNQEQYDNDDAHSHVNQLYHFGGLSALIYTLQSSFDDLHGLELNLMAIQYYGNVVKRKTKTIPTTAAQATTAGQYGTIQPVGDKTTTTSSDVMTSPVKAYKKTPKSTNRKDSGIPPPPPLPPLSLPTSSRKGRPPIHKRGHSALLATPLQSLFKRSVSGRIFATDNQANVDMQQQQQHGSLLPMVLWNKMTSTRHRRRRHDDDNDDNENVFNSYTKITDPEEPIMDEIYRARNQLRETTQFAQYVAAQALVFDDTEEQFPDKDKTPASEFTASQKLSSLLNLSSCFLYMTNYYVVAPTVGEYAVQLNSNEAMAGIIIGMTPNAALIATVLYGWWSNHSYRNALIFAACSSVIGNIFYALALYYNSLTIVLIGRFFNGFGSARSINRRYIADTFSKKDRTAASADFVTSGALGMAAGPGIAFLLGHVQFPDNNPLWSSVNAPGWVMLALWSIYLILAILFFQEPDRSHLYATKTTDDLMKNTDTEALMHSKESTEMQPLLIQGDLPHNGSGDSDIYSNDSPDLNKEPPIWKNVAVMMTLWMYFVLKLVLEMLLSSTSTVTKFYFGWNSKSSGLFMAFMALLMFPANVVVSKLSQRYEDRELIFWSLVMMLVSIFGIMDYSGTKYLAIQYVVFAIGIFISTNSLEGPNMGLLSKTIPVSWAKGTFNSGFLATEAGTAARSVGDVLITFVAGSLGLGMLLNGLFAPMAILVCLSLVLVRKFYNQMTESDDDDTASIGSMDESTISLTNNNNNRQVTFEQD